MASLADIDAILEQESLQFALPEHEKDDKIKQLEDHNRLTSINAILAENGFEEGFESFGEIAVQQGPQGLEPKSPETVAREAEDAERQKTNDIVTDFMANGLYNYLRNNVGHVPGAVNAITGFAQAGLDFASIAERLGIPMEKPYGELLKDIDLTADDWNRISTKLDQRASQESGMAGNVLRGAGRSITEALTLAPLARVAGPLPMILGFGTIAGNQAITEGRDAGLEGQDLAKHVLGQAIPEAAIAGAFSAVGGATGRPAIGGLEGVFTKDFWKIIGKEGVKGVRSREALAAGGQAIKHLVKAATAEGIEENITELMQNYFSASSGVENVNLLGELFKGNHKPLVDHIAQVSLATGFTMGGAGAISYGAVQAKNLTQKQKEKVADARATRASLAAALGVKKNALPESLRSAKQREAFLQEVQQDLLDQFEQEGVGALTEASGPEAARRLAEEKGFIEPRPKESEPAPEKAPAEEAVPVVNPFEEQAKPTMVPLLPPESVKQIQEFLHKPAEKQEEQGSPHPGLIQGEGRSALFLSRNMIPGEGPWRITFFDIGGDPRGHIHLKSQEDGETLLAAAEDKLATSGGIYAALTKANRELGLGQLAERTQAGIDAVKEFAEEEAEQEERETFKPRTPTETVQRIQGEVEESKKKGFKKKEAEPASRKRPEEMTQAEFVAEFEALDARVQAAEKTPDRKMTLKEIAAEKDNWKEFSRQRGYTEQEIADLGGYTEQEIADLERYRELASPSGKFPSEFNSTEDIHKEHVELARAREREEAFKREEAQGRAEEEAQAEFEPWDKRERELRKQGLTDAQVWKQLDKEFPGEGFDRLLTQELAKSQPPKKGFKKKEAEPAAHNVGDSVLYRDDDGSVKRGKIDRIDKTGAMQIQPVGSNFLQRVTEERIIEPHSAPATTEGFKQSRGASVEVGASVAGLPEGYKVSIGAATQTGNLFNEDAPGGDFDPEMGSLFSVNVPEAQRNKGVATRLAKEAIRLMAHNGSTKVKYVVPASEGGLALRDRLIKDGIISSATKKFESGTSIHDILIGKPVPKKTFLKQQKEERPETELEVKQEREPEPTVSKPTGIEEGGEVVLPNDTRATVVDASDPSLLTVKVGDNEFQIGRDAVRTAEYVEAKETVQEREAVVPEVTEAEIALEVEQERADHKANMDQQGELFDEPSPEIVEEEFKGKLLPNTKVVDEDGQPLTVFHGTVDPNLKTADLDPFHGFETTGALFFTDSQDIASQFTFEREFGELVTERPTGEVDEFEGEIFEEVEPGPILEAKIDLQNPLVLDGPRAQAFIDDTVFQQEQINKAKKDGHDGIIAEDVVEFAGDERGNIYAVFTKEQIHTLTPEQMTRSAYTAQAEDRGDAQELAEVHKDSVKDAVRNKRDVPREVLEDYKRETWAKRELDRRDAMEGEPKPAEQPIQQQFPTGDLYSHNAAGDVITAIDPNLPADEPLSNFTIRNEISRLFDVTIRDGRLHRADVAGIFKTQPEVIRMKRGYEGHLGYLTHELAHALDKRHAITQAAPVDVIAELALLDYDQNKQRAIEGFAEYMRMMMTTDVTSQFAPATTNWFVNEFLATKPDLKNKLAQVKGLTNRWRTQSSVERAKANIVTSRQGQYRSLNESLGEAARNSVYNGLNKFYYWWKDDANFLNQMVKEAKRRGYIAERGTTSIELQRALSQAGPDLAQRAFENGVFSMGQRPERLSGGLRDVMKSIGPERYDDWQVYMHARHAREVFAKNRANGTDINPGISESDANDAYARLHNDEFEAAHQAVTDFNNGLLLMLAEVGKIKHESAQAMINYWETYVPLARQKQGPRVTGQMGTGAGSIENTGPAVLRRVGSSLPVFDFIESTVERTMRFYTLAAQQLVINEMVNEATGVQGMGAWMEEVPASQLPTNIPIKEFMRKLNLDDQYQDEVLDVFSQAGVDPTDIISIYRANYNTGRDEPIVRITQNEKVRLFYMTPELFTAVTNVDAVRFNGATKVMGNLTRSFKLGTTGINPTFAARNLIRDAMVRAIQSESVSWKSIGVDPFLMMGAYVGHNINRSAGIVSKGIKNVAGDRIHEDPFVELFQQYGGELSALLGMDRRQEMIERVGKTLGNRWERNKYKILGDTKSYMKPLGYLGGAVDAVRALVNVTEVNSRLAEFKHVMEKMGWDKKRIDSEGPPPRNVIIASINAAADVTTNFKRMGTIGRQFNQWIPFFNARLEGLDKGIRTVRSTDPNIQKKVKGVIGIGIASTLGYWMIAQDQDEYDEMEDWLKYGFWNVYDENGRVQFRIPIPFEWGWSIKGATEMMLNFMKSKDPKVVSHFMTEYVNQLDPTGLPAGITPVAEAYFNKDLFRDQPIVGQGMARLEPRDQYEPYNTKLMKAIGNWTNISPKKLDFAANGLTGNLFSRIMRLDKTIEASLAAFGLYDKKATNAADVPVVGGFMIRSDPSVSRNEMFKNNTKIQQKLASARLKGDVPFELEDAARRSDQITRLVSKINRLDRDKLNRDERFYGSQRYGDAIARMALGKPINGLYPNPFVDEDVPESVREVVDEWVDRRLITATKPRPEKREAVEEWQRNTEIAYNDLKFTKISRDDLLVRARLAFRKEFTERGTRKDRERRLRQLMAQ